jgi:hypothetical protein
MARPMSTVTVRARIGHQAAWTSTFEPAHRAPMSRVATATSKSVQRRDALHEVVGADDVSPGGFGFASLVALCQRDDALGGGATESGTAEPRTIWSAWRGSKTCGYVLDRFTTWRTRPL